MEVVRVESIPAEGAERAELVMAEELYKFSNPSIKIKLDFYLQK